jgi:hypothetical protein
MAKKLERLKKRDVRLSQSLAAVSLSPVQPGIDQSLFQVTLEHTVSGS